MKIDIKDKAYFTNLLITDNNIYFPKHVYSFLSEYIEFVKKVTCSSDIIESISLFRDKIYYCLLDNYSGQANSSYSYFCEALDSIEFHTVFTSLKENSFYRVRKSKKDKDGNYILRDYKDMFHIPFECRYRVSTRRYSYPGLPCLYLGNTINVCMDEIGAKDDDDYANVANIYIKDISNIKVVDLFFFENYDFNNLLESQKVNFIKLWPLVMCCSLSYKEGDDMDFRPDYIIPQMLLEYIIDKKYSEMLNGKDDIIAGIRYHSAKRSMFPLNDEKKYVNYVFPVQKSREKGLCEHLERKFFVQSVSFYKDIK